jgi:hypothetical protein
MEGPLLILKSWALTALCIWVYQRWFQRVAPPAPEFEAFCRTRPVVAALIGVGERQADAMQRLRDALGASGQCVATLGGFPWPHYRLSLRVEARRDAVWLRIEAASVLRSRERSLPALASVLRDLLNELPDAVEAWAHAGTFNNGLVAVPNGGWSLRRGHERHPRFAPLARIPGAVADHLALENQMPCASPLGTVYTTPSNG